jgi:hypothetical protein
LRGELINKLEAAMVLDLKKQLKIGNTHNNHEEVITPNEPIKIKRHLPAIVSKPKKIYFSSKIQDAIEKLSMHKLVD